MLFRHIGGLCWVYWCFHVIVLGCVGGLADVSGLPAHFDGLCGAVATSGSCVCVFVCVDAAASVLRAMWLLLAEFAGLFWCCSVVLPDKFVYASSLSSNL